MGKIIDRAAFFSNPKTADGLNSKERRKLKREPLHEEWEAYQRRKNSDGRQTHKEENHNTRRVILTENVEQGQQKDGMAKDLPSQTATTRQVILTENIEQGQQTDGMAKDLPSQTTTTDSTEEVLDVHVDEEEYDTFLS